MSADIRIGTSGWHYKHWVGRYYPAGVKSGEMLRHYLRDFDTVELNNTFYHLPKEESFDSWRKATPPHDFVFAVKGSRFLTHMVKLEAVYVYFDNDDSAYAVQNALTLKRLVGGRRAAA